jgi:hypothetical protein
MAITTGAPIRVADAVMDRLAVPAGSEPAGTMPEQTARDLGIDQRPRYEPRNLDFAAGLARWVLGGSFTELAVASHWHDYQAAAEKATVRKDTAAAGAAVLSAAVPQPEGFAYLVQEIFADDYRGTTVTFRGEFRVTGDPDEKAGLFVRVMRPADLHGPMTAAQALADPANHVVTLEGSGDWTAREVTAPVPDDANTVGFGVFLAGPARIELRAAELTREN